MSFPLTSKTLAKLIKAIDAGFTDAQIGTLILEAGADRWAPRDWPNKLTRLQHLFGAMRESGDDDAGRAALELATLVLNAGAPRRRGAFSESRPADWWDGIVAEVAADGLDYDVEQGRLVPAVPGLQVADETTWIEAWLHGHGWATAAGHYRQALDSFAARNWASANSQLRTFLEDLIPAAAEKVSGSRPKEVQAALDALRKGDILLDDEFGFAKGLWSLCQPGGSHPGLSDDEEARFRLLTVSSYARFLLSRLPD
jgi:hypothetical protein